MAFSTSIQLAIWTAFMLLATESNAQVCSATGMNVTATGFVMDNLCIQQGFLINNPKLASLQHPEGHSVECLLLQACISSGYTILASPTSEGGNYTVKYDIGKDGTAAIVQDLKKLDGMALGYMVTVTGIDDNTMSNGIKSLKCVSIVNATTLSSSAVIPPAAMSPSTANEGMPSPAPAGTPPSASSSALLRVAISSLLVFGLLTVAQVAM